MPSLRERFRARFGRLPEVLTRAPGRLNLIGEHVDYNGGLVLPIPIDRYVKVAAARKSGRHAVVWSEALGDEARFRIGDGPHRGAHWSNYARGVSGLLEASGFDALVESNLPQGAGLSSSAAFDVALGKALVALFHLPVDPKALALVCQRVEHDFAGVKCGVMDPLAVTFARPGRALLLDCARLRFSYVPLARGDVRFAVCDTGVRRELASSRYNERREECERALGFFDRTFLCDVPLAELRRVTPRMPEVLKRRARHVVTENARVRAAVRALERRDFRTLGRLLSQSHRSLAMNYEVSSRELDSMARLARGLPGCYGARLVGAGFGGAVLAVVRKSFARRFSRAIEAEYRRATGIDSKVLLLRGF